MHETPDPTPSPDQDAVDEPRPEAVDDVIEAADDPGSAKERTGATQAAANREDDPPA
jgi:hypothetical protein